MKHHPSTHHPKMIKKKTKKRLNNFRWAECRYVLGAVIKKLLARTLFQPLPTPGDHFQGYVWQMGRRLKGCMEKTEMHQLCDPHQFSCRGTKVYYWEQVPEATAANWAACRLVWSIISRAKVNVWVCGTSPTYNLFPISAPLTFLKDMASCQLTSQLHFLCNGTLLWSNCCFVTPQWGDVRSLGPSASALLLLQWRDTRPGMKIQHEWS